jgi:hypothetical protein
MTSRPLTENDILELELTERLEDHEAQYVRYHVWKALPDERKQFGDGDKLNTVRKVFGAMVKRKVDALVVADAIDKGAGKKTIADELRALVASPL